MGIITEGDYLRTVISSPNPSLGFLSADFANKSAESLLNFIIRLELSLFQKLDNVLIISLAPTLSSHFFFFFFLRQQI